MQHADEVAIASNRGFVFGYRLLKTGLRAQHLTFGKMH